MAYQVRVHHLCSSIQSLTECCLRPSPTDPEAALLSSTSNVRIQAEQARLDIVSYIWRRWLTIKQEDGFVGLEPWAAGEICTGEFHA